MKIESCLMEEGCEFVPCLICNKANVEVLFQGMGLAQIVRCKNDGLVFLNPRPNVEFLGGFHSGFVRQDNLELFNGYRRNILRREAEVIKKIKSGGNLLDIGCATGTFFENFETGTWRLFGVDTSHLGAEKARIRYGADVFCGTLSEAHHPTGFFDVVTMLDTIYYAPDPRMELKEINRILKDDGVLAVEIPGLNYTFLREKGFLCWLLDKKWNRGLADSYHLYYFSPKTIRLLLEEDGFRLIKVVPEQASLGVRGIKRVINEIHFRLAQLMFAGTAGRISVSGKELYLACKHERQKL